MAFNLDLPYSHVRVRLVFPELQIMHTSHAASRVIDSLVWQPIINTGLPQRHVRSIGEFEIVAAFVVADFRLSFCSSVMPLFKSLTCRKHTNNQDRAQVR